MSSLTINNIPDFKGLEIDFNTVNENMFEDLVDLLYTNLISNKKNRKYKSEKDLDKLLSKYL